MTALISPPQIGALYLVANPGPTHSLLQGRCGEFIKAADGFWFLKIDNMLHRFKAYDPDKGSTNAIIPFQEFREGDWVEIDPTRRLTKHKDLLKSRLLIEDVDATTVVVLVEGNTDHAIELGHTEIRVIQQTSIDPTTRKRTEKRLALETKIRMAFADMMQALGEIARDELWRDATDADGNPYTTATTYLSDLLGLQRSQAGDYLRGAKIWSELTGVPVTDRPQSSHAMRELHAVAPEKRVETLQTLAEQGQRPTAHNIRSITRPSPPPSTGDTQSPQRVVITAQKAQGGALLQRDVEIDVRDNAKPSETVLEGDVITFANAPLPKACWWVGKKQEDGTLELWNGTGHTTAHESRVERYGDGQPGRLRSFAEQHLRALAASFGVDTVLDLLEEISPESFE